MPTKGPKKESKVYCRVCPDWEIKRPERCSNTLKRKGATLYFCTRRCKERFEKAPASFPAVTGHARRTTPRAASRSRAWPLR